MSLVKDTLEVIQSFCHTCWCCEKVYGYIDGPVCQDCLSPKTFEYHGDDSELKYELRKVLCMRKVKFRNYKSNMLSGCMAMFPVHVQFTPHKQPFFCIETLQLRRLFHNLCEELHRNPCAEFAIRSTVFTFRYKYVLAISFHSLWYW